MFSTSPVKGTFQKQLSGFFSVKGLPPPPTPLTENHFSKKTLAKKGVPLHNGRTVAPEAILFESPCRAHSETKIAQIICQGRDFNHLFYYS